jgi:hypothetical protein
MNILTQSPFTNEHPNWCDRAFCDAGRHVDIRHSSTPEVWSPTEDDVEVTVALHRDDERGVDGALLRHVHGVALRLENTGSVNSDGSMIRADAFLAPDDAERLAFQLLTAATRARAAVNP